MATRPLTRMITPSDAAGNRVSGTPVPTPAQIVTWMSIQVDEVYTAALPLHADGVSAPSALARTSREAVTLVSLHG